MTRDLNEITLIGRLVKDPEIKYTASGTPVTKFSIANNQSFTQNNEKKDYTNYFDINVWGAQATSCEKYLKKGSQVAVSGNLRQNRWQDQSSGQTRSKIEITAESVQFLSPINDNGQQNNPTGQQPNNYQQGSNYDPYQGNPGNRDSDIPF